MLGHLDSRGLRGRLETMVILDHPGNLGNKGPPDK